MLLARRLVNGRERGCLQVVSCSVLRLVNMSTRAMRLKTQARALACLQVVYLTFPVVKEQSLSASLVRIEKELFPLYLATAFGGSLRSGDTPLPAPSLPASSRRYAPPCFVGGIPPSRLATCTTAHPPNRASRVAQLATRHAAPLPHYMLNPFKPPQQPLIASIVADK